MCPPILSTILLPRSRAKRRRRTRAKTGSRFSRGPRLLKVRGAQVSVCSSLAKPSRARDRESVFSKLGGRTDLWRPLPKIQTFAACQPSDYLACCATLRQVAFQSIPRLQRGSFYAHSRRSSPPQTGTASSGSCKRRQEGRPAKRRTQQTRQS